MKDKEIQETVARLKAYAECFRKKTGCTPIEECNTDLCDGCTLLYAQGTVGQHLKDIETAIRVLENQPRWIPVSERLPEDNTLVLVTVKVGNREPKVRSGSYYMDGYFHIDNGDCWNSRDKELLAWLPLPEPYKGDEDN